MGRAFLSEFIAAAPHGDCKGDRSICASIKNSSEVGDLQHLCGALANDNAWRHRVARRRAGHDGCVCPEALTAPSSRVTSLHRNKRFMQ
jgi:hypothetical protein